MGKPGYVYLIRCANRWYRIGRTSNLEQRFRAWRWQLKKYGGSKLAGLVRVKNPRTAEKMFHRIFDDARSERLHGPLGSRPEWFKMTKSHLSLFWMWAAIIGESFIKCDLDLDCKGWLSALREIL